MGQNQAPDQVLGSGFLAVAFLGDESPGVGRVDRSSESRLCGGRCREYSHQTPYRGTDWPLSTAYDSAFAFAV